MKKSMALTIIMLISNNCFAASSTPADELDISASYNQVARLRKALTNGANPNGESTNDYSPLHKAAKFGAPDVIVHLLVAGADIEGLTRSGGATPLIIATNPGYMRKSPQEDWGNPYIVKILLRLGANVNAQDDLGRTALHYASAHGDLDIVNDLRAAGAKTDIKDNEGNVPISLEEVREKHEGKKHIEEESYLGFYA